MSLKLPTWATNADTTTEPPDLLKQTGAVGNTKLRAKYFNWLINTLCQWVGAFLSIDVLQIQEKWDWLTTRTGFGGSVLNNPRWSYNQSAHTSITFGAGPGSPAGYPGITINPGTGIGDSSSILETAYSWILTLAGELVFECDFSYQTGSGHGVNWTLNFTDSSNLNKIELLLTIDPVTGAGHWFLSNTGGGSTFAVDAGNSPTANTIQRLKVIATMDAINFYVDGTLAGSLEKNLVAVGTLFRWTIEGDSESSGTSIGFLGPLEINCRKA